LTTSAAPMLPRARFVTLFAVATLALASIVLAALPTHVSRGPGSFVGVGVSLRLGTVMRHPVRLHQAMVPLLRKSIDMPSSSSSRYPLTRVRAEEKKGPEFHKAKVASIEEAAAGGVYTVKVDSPTTLSQYTTPGQFSQIKVGDIKPGFFAMANKPGEDSLEFLIKKVDGAAGTIVGLKSGDELEITDVMGKGFPWDNVKDNDKYNGGTYVFATGTGFGPIKAMIEEGLFKGRKGLKIYYGARNEEHVPFRQKFDEWFKEGLLGNSEEIPIVPVYSCDGTEKKEKQYVQDVAVVDTGDHIDPKTASAIICGHFDMTNTMKEKLVGELGFPPENILTNF